MIAAAVFIAFFYNNKRFTDIVAAWVNTLALTIIKIVPFFGSFDDRVAGLFSNLS